MQHEARTTQHVQDDIMARQSTHQSSPTMSCLAWDTSYHDLSSFLPRSSPLTKHKHHHRSLHASYEYDADEMQEERASYMNNTILVRRGERRGM